MKRISLLVFLGVGCLCSHAQHKDAFREKYEAFKQQKQKEYQDFRQKANKEYVEFMRKAWTWYQDKSGIPIPVHPDPPIPAPVPPDVSLAGPLKKRLLPYNTVIDVPRVVEPPTPVAPIPEEPQAGEYLDFVAYGTKMKVRFPSQERFVLKGVSEKAVAAAWETLCGNSYNNLLRDCLALRAHYQLCDWAYLCVLEQLAATFCGKDTSEAVLLQAFLFHQSGYKVRLGRSKTNRLYMLVASRHVIYRMNYFEIDGEQFYPLHYQEKGLYLYENAFPKEQQLSLEINRQPLFAEAVTETRVLQSKGTYAVKVSLSFNKNLIDFYNGYPQSYLNHDATTKWRFYAKAPLSQSVKARLYPVLTTAIAGKSEREAANILINFVQTALTYGYDDEIWGGDRPFFADETLYYPYSDCEDRAILFSTLIRDLLYLDTVLLYYPGHLAMAVHFQEEVGGHTFLINKVEYTYCEPTCSGFASVGWCPEELVDVKPIIVTLGDGGTK